MELKILEGTYKNMKKKIEIKNKLINYLMSNGRKETSEKILLKSFKELQKNSTKNPAKLLKLALINTTPVFRIYKFKHKKKKKYVITEIPIFIFNKNLRTSSSIKLILANLKKSEKIKFHQKLKKEILLSATNNKASTVQVKNKLQKSVLMKRRYFFYYRWK